MSSLGLFVSRKDMTLVHIAADILRVIIKIRKHNITLRADVFIQRHGVTADHLSQCAIAVHDHAMIVHRNLIDGTDLAG